MKKTLLFVFVLFSLISTHCIAQMGGRMNSHLPSVIVYKTKADYSNYVPVTLSEDKSHIQSYPAPQDVFYNGNLAKPTSLDSGYLLDNRGIGPNSAFIKMTYEEYSKLKDAPPVGDLYNMILDKKPFTAIYDLGPRNQYPDTVNDINKIIKHHKLKKYTKVL